MKRHRNRFATSGLFGCLLAHICATTALATGPTYHVLNLGTLGGTITQAYGINDLGQVVGLSFTPGNAAQHAFSTAAYSAISPVTSNLGSLGGGQATARDINNLGQVVGDSRLSGGGLLHAFRTAAGAPINPATDDLGTLGGNYASAGAINDNGQVVGQSYDSNNHGAHAFATATNGLITPATDLGVYPGSQSMATGINASGQVVGKSGASSNFGFRTTVNSPIAASSNLLPGGFSGASGINDSGQVTGAYFVSEAVGWHAFRTQPNVAINPGTDDLGSLDGESLGFAINNQGDVVGKFETNDEFRAFAVLGNTMYDLNTRMDSSGAGWFLYSAEAINNSGAIVVNGFFNNQSMAALLIPVPEPSSFVLLVLGLGGLAFWQRRRT